MLRAVLAYMKIFVSVAIIIFYYSFYHCFNNLLNIWHRFDLVKGVLYMYYFLSSPWIIVDIFFNFLGNFGFAEK